MRYSLDDFFFFNDTATTEIYTLSLHDALPIYQVIPGEELGDVRLELARRGIDDLRSEEHTSELQSQSNLVCRLLLEKKKKTQRRRAPTSILYQARTNLLIVLLAVWLLLSLIAP